MWISSSYISEPNLYCITMTIYHNAHIKEQSSTSVTYRKCVHNPLSVKIILYFVPSHKCITHYDNNIIYPILPVHGMITIYCVPGHQGITHYDKVCFFPFFMLNIIIHHWGQWEDSFGYTDPSISITVRILTDILFYLLYVYCSLFYLFYIFFVHCIYMYM
jgi:hypothetical protein